ncbi:MAG TPA: chromate efflux transporter [Candidatus Limnocylindrales bacterium]|nr:chromate efflux transporter [Candidatus Limnocylindrales bacterium]
MDRRVPLTTIAAEWLRLGAIGFGGPPTHIRLLRRLCVERRGWMTAEEFEDGIAATTLLPGPASTQLAIYCAWRIGGAPGGLLGGACFIAPGLVAILVLAAIFLSQRPPGWVLGAAAGAGAAVPAVAIAAAAALLPASLARTGPARLNRVRWIVYLLAGATAAATVGEWLVLLLIACGLAETIARGQVSIPKSLPAVFALTGSLSGASALALAWVAFKVGALSYGGGFVIIPLMQHDVVQTYHWMTGSQFLDAVALGQVTPGPVVLTVAVVGYAAGGSAGGLLATLVAFAPSFAFVLIGGPHFRRVRQSALAQAFLLGAGPTAIGAIAGASIPLALALTHSWQAVVLALTVVWLLVLRRGVVSALLGTAALGMLITQLGIS